MDKPCISIIVPVYNAENTIKKTIKSIRNQTLTNIEIIFINDGSKDSSIDILEKYSKIDNRIKILNQENLGVSKARNKGIELAVGEYISFVDSDDYIEENMYSRLYNKAKRFNIDIVKGSYTTEWKSGEGNDRYYNLDENLIYNKDFINKVVIRELIGVGFDRLSDWLNGKKFDPYYFVWGTIYKSELIKKNNIFFNEEIKIGEDVLFNLYSFYYAESFEIVNKPMYHWVDNNESITRNVKLDLCRSKLIGLEKRREFCRKNNLDDCYKNSYRCQSILLCIYSTKYMSNISNYNTKEVLNEIKYIFNSDIVNESREYLILSKIPKKYYLPFMLVKFNLYKSMYLIVKVISKLKFIN